METNTDIQMENLSDIKRRLQIVVPSAEVTEELNRAYKDLGKRVKIKGFRPGKVPRSVLEMYYKKQVQEEVSDTLVRRSLVDALKEKSLTAVGFNWPEPVPPVISGEDFRYQVEVEVPPEFTARNYKGLTLEDWKVEVTDDMVEARLEEIRQSNAMLEPVTESRGAREGDFVVLDYQGYFAGEALPEAKAENTYLEIGAGKFNLDFEKNLIGLTPGQETRFAVELPQDFFNPLLAGKVIEFQVKVQELKQKVVPELDDAFAEGLEGNFQTLADLRQAIREDIINVRERERQMRLENQAIDQLIAGHPFEAPPSLIRQEQEGILREQVHFMQSQGLNLEGLDLEKMLERLKPKAERRVRLRLIFDKIAAQEHLALDEGELEAKLAEIAGRSRRPLAQVKQYYEENNLMEGLARQLLDEKVMKLILDAAELTQGGEPAAQETS
jgi:trigger factor|uniref:Trigger factor n=1 Tax=Desulfobacca acetoxidans TaxID=60893 RepID=A0A7V6DQ39_9BACT